MPDWIVHQGDCRDILATLPDNSIDAIVTDPPAGIGFMGVAWDTYSGTDGNGKGGPRADTEWDWIGSKERPRTADAQRRVIVKQGRAFRAFLTPIMTECLRVLKPGGHAFIWALPRTSHWTATAVEDAGFELRECVTHLFGSGFPKSMDLALQYEQQLCQRIDGEWRYISDSELMRREPPFRDPLANQWSGWGTALKPAVEFWWLARKPLSEPTVAANVAKWGTGAINVDGCRIPTADILHEGAGKLWSHYRNGTESFSHGERPVRSTEGRWPANLTLSHSPDCREVGTKRVKATSIPTIEAGDFGKHGTYGKANGKTTQGYDEGDGLETVTAWECAEGCAVRILDEQSGVSGSNAIRVTKRPRNKGWVNGSPGDGVYALDNYGDTGGASRFYYCSKSSRTERDAGLDGAHNPHPTVKSLSLCDWLIRLITPPGGLVLDPFCGSGSIGCSTVRQGYRFIGIDLDADYCEIARRRIAYWQGPVFAGVPS